MAEVILVESTEALTHVALRGRLDAVGVRAAEPKLTSYTMARRKPAIIDLSEVTYIASLGIGMLVGIANSMKSDGLGVVVLVGRTQVRDMLELTGIHALIPLAATREEALEKLRVS